jgi:hypothetical protein
LRDRNIRRLFFCALQKYLLNYGLHGLLLTSAGRLDDMRKIWRACRAGTVVTVFVLLFITVVAGLAG